MDIGEKIIDASNDNNTPNPNAHFHLFGTGMPMIWPLACILLRNAH